MRCGDRLRCSGWLLTAATFRRRTAIEQPNGVSLWGLGSRWNAERDQAADFSAAKKLPSASRCVIRWDLWPRRGGSTLGALVLRHAESAPAEEVGDPLKPDSF